ncbi:c-type cytochrome [Pseudomonadota bacterium]
MRAAAMSGLAQCTLTSLWAHGINIYAAAVQSTLPRREKIKYTFLYCTNLGERVPMLKMKMFAIPAAFAVTFTMAFGVATLSVTAPAEAKTGEQLAKTCKMCHPKKKGATDLTTIDPQEIAVKMKAYASGELKHSMMKGVSKKLSDEEIKAVSDFVGKKVTAQTAK